MIIPPDDKSQVIQLYMLRCVDVKSYGKALRRWGLMRIRDRKLIKSRKYANKLTKRARNEYNPGSRAVRPWRFQGGRGVQRGLGGNPNPPSPSGPSGARNLLRSIKITLKKYGGIVIVAFGSAPILVFLRLGYVGDFIPKPLTRDFIP